MIIQQDKKMGIAVYRSMQLPKDVIEFWKSNQKHPFHDYEVYGIVIKNRIDSVEPVIFVERDQLQVRSLVISRIETVRENLKIGYLTVFKPRLKTLRITYKGFLGGNKTAVSSLMLEAIHEFQKENSIDQVVFTGNSEDPLFNAVLKNEKIQPLVENNRSKHEHWCAGLPEDFDEFLNKRKKNHRRHIRSKKKKLYAEHEVENRLFMKKEEMDELLHLSEEVARNTYQRGIDAGFKNDGETKEIFEIFARDNRLRGFVMKIDGKPRAFWIGRMYRDCCYLDYTGFDRDFREYEIGTLSFLDLINELIKQGVKNVDFGLGYAEYKVRFCDRMILEEEVRIFSERFTGNVLKMKRKITVHLTQWFNYKFRNTFMYNKVKKIWRSKIKNRNEKENEKLP